MKGTSPTQYRTERILSFPDMLTMQQPLANQLKYPSVTAKLGGPVQIYLECSGEGRGGGAVGNLN